MQRVHASPRASPEASPAVSLHATDAIPSRHLSRRSKWLPRQRPGPICVNCIMFT